MHFSSVDGRAMSGGQRLGPASVMFLSKNLCNYRPILVNADEKCPGQLC